MTPNKVYWLLDEVFAQTHPQNWSEVIYLANTLISLIGNKQLEHEVINPIDSFRKLAGKLIDISGGLHVSTIIDISRWVGYGLKPIFPQAELYTDFSLSRILDVSTADFETVGYITNVPQDEITKRANELDLSGVLIIDDVGFTGRTNSRVMDIFGIKPINATHLLLLANTGCFPKAGIEPADPGAVGFLEGLGSQVLYGDKLDTPNDDAEHLLDLFQHPVIERGFSAALRLHNHVRTSQYYREQLHLFLSNDGSTKDLFPQQVEEIDIARLSAENRFVRDSTYSSSENAIYSRSPILWTFNDFWRKIDESSLYGRREEILHILKGFQSLSSTDNIVEIRQVFTREALGMIKERET